MTATTTKYACLACVLTIDLFTGDKFPRDTEHCSHEFEQTPPTSLAPNVGADYAVGLWVPIYYGNHFRIARRHPTDPHAEETCPTVFSPLAAAVAECQRRNNPDDRNRL